MIYGDCLRFASTGWLSQEFSLRWASSVGISTSFVLIGGSRSPVLFLCVFLLFLTW